MTVDRNGPALLISVRSAEEAAIALAGGADIIDVKEPQKGVLGAAPADTIRAIVSAVAGRRPVSATIGDVPLTEAASAVDATAATGVDYIKIGTFYPQEARIDLAPFRFFRPRGVRLVLVLFADLAPDFGLIAQAAEAGFTGVMLDTAEKGQGGLRSRLSPEQLEHFVAQAHRCGLLAGLAGSLAATDIAPLIRLRPDILGFRGAACTGSQRNGALDSIALRALRRLFLRPIPTPETAELSMQET